jgi:hypothetical protein
VDWACAGSAANPKRITTVKCCCWPICLMEL